jgi:hypothetical protein
MRIVDFLELPPAFTTTLLTLSMLLTIAPYLSRANFGIFRIPALTIKGKRILRIVGPICLLFSIFLFVPLPKGKGLLLTDHTKVNSSIRMEGNRLYFEATADRSLPQPSDLAGGGRIDFIWFVDADKNRNTGQNHRGNDYNIHLFVDEREWGIEVYTVSEIALKDEVKKNFPLAEYYVKGRCALISLPISFFPSRSFRWWLEVSGLNASDEWKKNFKYRVVTPEDVFGQ